jgi:DNA-binding transcriptional LysR family regulator
MFLTTIHGVDTTPLDLNLLVTLEALLAEQNVTRAAARLHLSQPAVSAQLSRLRDMFDDQLLIAAHRGMTPTAKAIELLDPLRKALDQVRATVATHTNYDPGSARLTVAIACTDYLQVAVIKPLVVILASMAPGVRVAMRNLDLQQLEAQMTRGDVDLALMTPQAAPPNLRTRHLFDERYVLIGRRRHPRLHNAMTVDEFAQLEHVIVSLRGGDFVTPVDDVLAALGQRRNVMLSAASFLFVPDIVSESDFVALVPERLVRGRAEELMLIECPFPVEGFAVGLVWHERSHGHSGHRWIREAIVSLVNARTSKRKAPCVTPTPVEKPPFQRGTRRFGPGRLR